MTSVLDDKPDIQVSGQVDGQLNLSNGTNIDRQRRIRPKITVCSVRVNYSRDAV